MMDMISGATLVCVGETHDNIHAHNKDDGPERAFYCIKDKIVQSYNFV